jgi:hypothetical protein
LSRTPDGLPLDAFFHKDAGLKHQKTLNRDPKLTLDAGAILVRTQYFVNLSLQTFWSYAGRLEGKVATRATSLSDHRL